MKAVYDEDSANAVYREDQAQRTWEKERKNQILNMTNPQKKQVEWNKLFPHTTYSEEINSMVF